MKIGEKIRKSIKLKEKDVNRDYKNSYLLIIFIFQG